MQGYDIPILLEFFARPSTFSKVFDEVKKIKPKTLYLYQDAPRGPKDEEGWKKCREIAEDIDWECDVHKFYQEKNQGCDPSGFIAQSWFFSEVEYGIVLEDDIVVNEAFFIYMKKMLEKYKDDEEISLVCGMNLLDTFDNPKDPASYFFTKHGGIWGWGSWKRFYSKCDPTYSWLDDKAAIKNIKKDFYSRREARYYIKKAKQRRVEGKAYFETIVYAASRSNNMLHIVPSVNYVCNIGIGMDASGTHSPSDLNRLPPKTRRLFHMERHPLPDPFIDPKGRIRNIPYERKICSSVFDPLIQKFYALKYVLTHRHK